MKKMQYLATVLFMFLTPLSVSAASITLESLSSVTGVNSSIAGTNINGLTGFERTGDFSEIFRNNTNTKFTDFHFVFVNFGADATADGGTIFKDIESSRPGSSGQFQEINFFLGSNGTGILPGESFEIKATGFNNIGSSGTKTIIRMNPTIPEPASLVLLGLGLAGFRFSKNKKAV